jgi:outer membrane protein assembly factor BamB
MRTGGTSLEANGAFSQTAVMPMKPSPSSTSAVLAASAAFVLLSVATRLEAANWPQWRGPTRNGQSPEAGLLREWPKEGPKLLWQVRDLGDGFSTPSVVDGRLYVLANKGADDEFVQAREVKDGKQIWSSPIGKTGPNTPQMNWSGARSTPTVDGNLLFALGSDGDLVCLELGRGEPRTVWKKSLRTDFGGKPGSWAYAESPLVDGDAVVCTPGGKDATIVALSKKTGDVLWKCALPEDEEAAYSSIVVVETDRVRQYVQLLQKGLVGVDPKTGKFLWRYAKPVSPYNANIPTPVPDGGHVYVSSAGLGGGLVKLTVKDGGVTPEQVYFESKLPTAIGGAVKVGDYLYGTTGSALLCIDFKSGTVKWDNRAIGTASICVADGLLFLHGENGDVALVEASPEAYREKGRFTPPEQPKHARQMEKAWAHPVIADGRLFIRDLNSLWCYGVK